MRNLCFLAILIAATSLNAADRPERRNALYFDSTVNPAILKLAEADTGIKTIDGYPLVSRARLDSIIHRARTKFVTLYMKDGTRERLTSWNLEGQSIRGSSPAPVDFANINKIAIRDKFNYAKLLVYPLAGGLYLGLTSAAWEGIDYLYDRHFGKTEVFSLCAAGAVLGLIVSFFPDDLFINFQKPAVKRRH